ncbi:hypothetical protein EV356DRAFT_18413 [Viridothelium virens]|uniref:Uncharacterized protein n=1 Tax=Viridothelium virens TaxID=1048519 RepID=A0A6A6GU31_VIRVR|nr:hypothetical protein EV356DRAFT_18413 [Viridothelium virens]
MGQLKIFGVRDTKTSVPSRFSQGPGEPLISGSQFVEAFIVFSPLPVYAVLFVPPAITMSVIASVTMMAPMSCMLTHFQPRMQQTMVLRHRPIACP